MFKSVIYLILIGIISITAFCGCIEKQETDTQLWFGDEPPVNIEDPDLEQLIRDELDKPDGNLYPSDLAEITGLTIRDCSITDWSGLDHCTNVTQLNISIENNYDLSPLTKLQNLEELFIAPACLKWEHRENVTQNTSGNGFSTARSSCVEQAEVSNIILPSEFPNLKLLFSLGSNISDLSSLSGLTDLETLIIANHQTLDLSTFPYLKNLTDLQITNQGITGLHGIAKLKNLQKLSLDNNWSDKHQALDITPLAHLTNLTQLYLADYTIADIQPLTNLVNLTKLALIENTISDISPLENLVQLTELGLSHNPIADISPLANLTQLTHLYLQETGITDISCLENVTNLEWLDLSSNNITDISPLAQMKNLVMLRLSDNQITNVAPVSNFTNLHCLELDNNGITDISPLVSNQGIGREAEEIVMEHGRGYSDWETRREDTINLCGNPLNEDAILTHVPQLKSRGALLLCGHFMMPRETE